MQNTLSTGLDDGNVPLILHNHLTAPGHATEEKLCCFTFPRGNIAICGDPQAWAASLAAGLGHGFPATGRTLHGSGRLTCLAEPAALQYLSSGSTALEGANSVSVGRKGQITDKDDVCSTF